MRRTGRVALVVIILGALLGCVMEDAEAPSFMGPSELALSISLQANPAVLPFDGASQSLVSIEARGPSGQPVSNLSLRLQLEFDGVLQDVGRLSARSVITARDGRAAVTYTAPWIDSTVDTDRFVSILVTETDTRDAHVRKVDISLVPPGVVTPPAPAPEAVIIFSPQDPVVGQTVFFDGSTSTGRGLTYAWDFGDGFVGSGPLPSHIYSSENTFVVSLRVTDDTGASDITTQEVQVSSDEDSSAGPTAEFTISPVMGTTDTTFNFDASASVPQSTIEAYTWNFGDGNFGVDPTVTHKFATADTYLVGLTVRDDQGRTDTTSQTLEVEDP